MLELSTTFWPETKKWSRIGTLTTKTWICPYSGNLLRTQTDFCTVPRVISSVLFRTFSASIWSCKIEFTKLTISPPVYSRIFQTLFSSGRVARANESKQCHLTSCGSRLAEPVRAGCATGRAPAKILAMLDRFHSRNLTCGDMASPPGTSGGCENSTWNTSSELQQAVKLPSPDSPSCGGSQQQGHVELEPLCRSWPDPPRLPHPPLPSLQRRNSRVLHQLWYSWMRSVVRWVSS